MKRLFIKLNYTIVIFHNKKRKREMLNFLGKICGGIKENRDSLVLH